MGDLRGDVGPMGGVISALFLTNFIDPEIGQTSYHEVIISCINKTNDVYADIKY